MTHQARIIVCAAGFTSAMAVACIIPDKGIVVIDTDCGEEWVVSTAGAIGYNGLEVPEDILTDDEHWIKRTYCVTPSKGDQLADPNSAARAEVLNDIILKCEQRAVQLGLVNTTCTQVATIAYVGTCPSMGCNEEDGEETAEAETGGGLN